MRTLQLQMAESSGKPILQWRIEDLDTGRISDPRHRALLERETVLAVGIEEFKRTIKETGAEEEGPGADETDRRIRVRRRWGRGQSAR
jgi:hypothetical protein